MSMKPRKQFKWMNAFWSCSNEEWEDLNWRIEKDMPFDMDNCRELVTRPKGVLVHLREKNNLRYEGAAQ